MSLKLPTTFLGWVKLVAISFALVLVASWTASQCRYWKSPKAPETIPGHVDAGAPVAGPSSDRPTVTTTEAIARPALTRAEVLAEMARVGIKPEIKPARVVDVLKHGSNAPAAPPDSGSVNETPAQEFPIFFGKERFGMALGAAGEVAVEVSAWQLEPGAKIDLRGRWEDYTPPKPPAALAGSPICGAGEGFFGNEGRWEKEIGVGLLATQDGAGPGGMASVVYRGPRTGRANWGARALVAGGTVNSEATGFGLLTAKVSF
ncbi:MAG: hypothetical protein ABIU84_08865 [Thermoanaerobaculia bacterium]